MSEPFSPPPPPYSPPPPPTGNASAQVQGPATGLLVHGGIGIAFTLLGLLMNLLGTGMSSFENLGGGDASARYMNMMSGGLGIVMNIIGLAVLGFIVWGAMQMKQMRGWSMAVGASVVAIIPCFGCYLIGIPVGIWSLVVLMKPEVKAAFHG